MTAYRNACARLRSGHLLLALALAAQGAEAGEAQLEIQVQSCHEPEFAFLFNEEAREAFNSCDEPLIDFSDAGKAATRYLGALFHQGAVARRKELLMSDKLMQIPEDIFT